MIGGLVCKVRRVSFPLFQRSFSVVSCGSVMSKKISSSFAMHVDSMFTSVNFCGKVFTGF